MKCKVDYRKLSELLLNKGISYEDLAKACGVSKTAVLNFITRVRKGERILNTTIYKYATALGIKPSDLVLWEDNQ